MSTHHPRRFELVREEDVSGTSGTGVVAVGVAYPDGAVHMQWRNESNEDLRTSSNGCAFKPAPDGVDATVEVHGHDGRTELRWIDDPQAFDPPRDPDTGERLYHYEWNGWWWCDRENEAFDWETGTVECPHCGDTFEVSEPEGTDE